MSKKRVWIDEHTCIDYDVLMEALKKAKERNDYKNGTWDYNTNITTNKITIDQKTKHEILKKLYNIKKSRKVILKMMKKADNSRLWDKIVTDAYCVVENKFEFMLPTYYFK